jgi:signal transduction histidine kinase
VAEQTENIVLEHLRGLRNEIGDIKQTLKTDMATKSDIHSLRADVASDLLAMQADMRTMQKDTRDQIVGLRRAVVEYHSAVVGHGLISELEERVRRLEQHLKLPSLEPR